MRRGPSIAAAAVLLALYFHGGVSSACARSAPAEPAASEGTRSVAFVSSFSSQADVQKKPSFWRRMANFVAGPATLRHLVRPYGLAEDTRGRIVVTDPGALKVHIFDFEKHAYEYLDGGGGQKFQSPIGVAIDSNGYIYVTDSRLGMIFVFTAKGKFRRFLGNANGEGQFKRPTGIAIDPVSREIFVADTLHHKIFVLNPEGLVVRQLGERGEGPGQFNFPTELAIRQEKLFVVDAMNFRVQFFDLRGSLLGSFGELGNQTGTFNRPKGIAVDSEGNVYVVDAQFETVQIFNPLGELLYYFGESGEAAGEFQLPMGLCIGKGDRIYVADSYNRRIQVFQLVRSPVLSGAP